MAIHRLGSAPLFTSTGNSATILTQSVWTTAMADTDDGKLILTPKFGAWTMPNSDIVVEGENDNAMPGGYGVPQEGGPISPTFTFHDTSPEAIDALRALSGEPALEAYFINRFGQVLARKDGYGIPIQNFYVGARSSSYNVTDKNNGRVSVAPDWDKNTTIVSPTWNILAMLPKN